MAHARIAMLFVTALAAAAAAQAPPAHHLVIRLPPEVASERILIRYVLAGERFGGQVSPPPHVSSYAIDTTVFSVPATGIKAILYAPGCEIRTLDLALSAAKDDQADFPCLPLETLRLNAKLLDAVHFSGHGLEFEVRYIARWARAFLGLTDETVMVIPLGILPEPAADGSFQLSVPNFARDPVATAHTTDEEIQILLRDQATHDLLAQLTPAGADAIATDMGNLMVLPDYPPEVFFASRVSEPAVVHDGEGFARRP